MLLALGVSVERPYIDKLVGLLVLFLLLFLLLLVLEEVVRAA